MEVYPQMVHEYDECVFVREPEGERKKTKKSSMVKW